MYKNTSSPPIDSGFKEIQNSFRSLMRHWYVQLLSNKNLGLRKLPKIVKITG
jgi:hypothetical protein